MEMLNRVIEDAAAFQEILQKVTRKENLPPQRLASAEVLAWNLEVDRKKAEKKARNRAMQAQQKA